MLRRLFKARVQRSSVMIYTVKSWTNNFTLVTKHKQVLTQQEINLRNISSKIGSRSNFITGYTKNIYKPSLYFSDQYGFRINRSSKSEFLYKKNLTLKYPGSVHTNYINLLRQGSLGFLGFLNKNKIKISITSNLAYRNNPYKNIINFLYNKQLSLHTLTNKAKYSEKWKYERTLLFNKIGQYSAREQIARMLFNRNYKFIYHTHNLKKTWQNKL